jgi:polysaccharide biosynthesis transport protein
MKAVEQQKWLGPTNALVLVGRALRTSTWWIALPLGLFAVVGVLTVVRPIYRSEEVLLYKPPPGASMVSQSEGDVSRQLGARLKDMLFTRARLSVLIKEFNLYPDKVAEAGMPDAIDEIRKHLKFESSGGDAFRITFEDESPLQAQAVTARAAEMLLDVHRQLRTQDVVKAQQFFDVQKHQAEEALRKRESEFADFIGEHPEMAQVFGTGPMTPGASLRAINADRNPGGSDSSLSSLEARASRLRERGSESPKLEKVSTADPQTPPPDASLLAEREAVQADLVAARRELAQKQKQFTSEYPDVRLANEAVIAARERLRKIDETIAAAKKGTPVAPPADLSLPRAEDAPPSEVTRRRLAALGKQIAKARARMLERDPKRLAELGTQMAELDRRVTEARDRLAVLQSKQFQASLQATLDLQDKSGELAVVDPAFLPARAERRGRVRTGALGAGAAMALAFGLALTSTFFSDRLRAGFDLARLGLPTLLVHVPSESRRERKRARLREQDGGTS